MKMIITIDNAVDYVMALNRMLIIFDAPKGTIESDEADLLIKLIEEYENKNFLINV
jgi:HTH-type transcriptional regulator/antitoxin HigA